MKGTQVIGCSNQLKELANRKLPLRLGYMISVNLGALDQVAAMIEEQRVKLLEMYCDKDEGGNPVIEGAEENKPHYRMSEEGTKEFLQEYSAFLNEDFDVEIKPIAESLLLGIEDDTRYDPLTINELNMLKFMIS